MEKGVVYGTDVYHAGEVADKNVMQEAYERGKNQIYTYIQVTASMLEEHTFERKMRPLREIRDNYRKMVLTLDEYSVGIMRGLKYVKR